MAGMLLFLTGCNGNGDTPTRMQTLQPSQNNTVLVDYPGSQVIPTPDPAQISINHIQFDEKEAVLVISWNARGSFPGGFKIIFSGQSDNPIYPIDPFISIGDEALRQGLQFSGDLPDAPH
jgi:hypothetical protein